MYVATKKTPPSPHFFLPPDTWGMDDSLAVGILSIQRSGSLSVLLGDQGDGRRSSSYSACKAEGSRLALPGCLKHRAQESKGFLKREGRLSAFLEKALSTPVFSVLVWSTATECRFIWAGQDWRKHRIGILQEGGWPKPSCPSSVWCTLALLAVCLLSLCVTVSPVELGTRGSSRQRPKEIIFKKLSFCWFDLCFSVWVQHCVWGKARTLRYFI